MKITRLLPLSCLALSLSFASCEDGVSPIGGSLTQGETTITIDSTTYDLNAITVANDRFDARSGFLLLGNLDVPEYGKLNCSFVSRLIPVTSLPEKIDTVPLNRIDGMKMVLGYTHTNTVGDSLAPQQLKAFRLTKQLPSGITNQFDPTGYYDPKDVWGKKSFTASEYGKPDSIGSTGYVYVKVDLPASYATEIINAYRYKPEIFQWPDIFAKEFLPGIYVESSFGKGCVNIISSLGLFAYFHNPRTTTTTVDGESVTTTKNVTDSVCFFAKAPEVLSSNRVAYEPSEYIKNKVASGETILTTPGGYEAHFRFPAEQIIEQYNNQKHNLSIISALTMTIPAESVANDYNIAPTPYLLMIKTKEIDSFFAENKVPDNLSSFYASYDSSLKGYRFGALREYLLNLLDQKTLSDEDLDFTFIPVMITQETPSAYSSYTVVTKCVPLSYLPTMTNLDTHNARIVFTFTSQIVE